LVTQPEGQGLHDVGSTLAIAPLPPVSLYSMNVPAEHEKHSDALPDAHVPAGHCVQTADSSRENFPATHDSQLDIGGNVVTPFLLVIDL
jgi:hypothetical protein